MGEITDDHKHGAMAKFGGKPPESAPRPDLERRIELLEDFARRTLDRLEDLEDLVFYRGEES